MPLFADTTEFMKIFRNYSV